MVEVLVREKGRYQYCAETSSLKLRMTFSLILGLYFNILILKNIFQRQYPNFKFDHAKKIESTIFSVKL